MREARATGTWDSGRGNVGLAGRELTTRDAERASPHPRASAGNQLVVGPSRRIAGEALPHPRPQVKHAFRLTWGLGCGCLRCDATGGAHHPNATHYEKKARLGPSLS
ncbi:hypothetical protein Lesp02_19880 [Lentzea sp. NBRC 105346]|nr:hypothetical protein Lesp02_19880 [Lentzea sp. NBRC 105346]